MGKRDKFFDTYKKLIEGIEREKPLVHHITNNVTVNDCANIILNWNGLPVMAPGPEEAEEMVMLASALVLNIGTLDSDQLKAMIKAGKKANELNIPVILDPVGVGATSYRTKAVKKIIEEINLTVIKGNQGEISILAGETGKVKGVESIGEYSKIEKSAAKLAIENECVVVVSGKQDIVTDGNQYKKINRGHYLMGEVVGTGCMLSSTIALFTAIGNIIESNPLDVVWTAVRSYDLAGEKAGVGKSTPGYFKIEFMDTIYKLSRKKSNIKEIYK